MTKYTEFLFPNLTFRYYVSAANMKEDRTGLFRLHALVI